MRVIQAFASEAILVDKPDGSMTVIFDAFFVSSSCISKPGGRKEVNPLIRSGYPWKRAQTRPIADGVSIL